MKKEEETPKDGASAGVVLERIVMPQDESKYLDDLWVCFKNGVDQEGLPEEDLFKALVADLIKQMSGLGK